jgi:hypothetical protein
MHGPLNVKFKNICLNIKIGQMPFSALTFRTRFSLFLYNQHNIKAYMTRGGGGGT